MMGIELPEAVRGWPEFRVASVDAGTIGVSWRDGKRTHGVMAYDEDSALVLAAPICRDSGVDPRLALKLAARLRAGAVVLGGNVYLVRCVIPAARRDDANVIRALRWIAAEAAVLRRYLGGRVDTNPLHTFALYAE
jgi:hypothetical protein